MSALDEFAGERQNDKRYFGVYEGEVTNNKNGEVKIKFAWRSDQNESNPARVATLMAGKQMGSFFLPDVGDEVLVAFKQGDIDQPYIIGSLWNGQDKAPEKNADGKNNIRKIKSRSGHEIAFVDNKEEKKEKLVVKTGLGHAIELDDKDGKGKVSVTTNAGHSMELDDENNFLSLKDTNGNKIEMSKNGIVISDANGNKITMDSSGVDINGKFSIGS